MTNNCIQTIFLFPELVVVNKFTINTFDRNIEAHAALENKSHTLLAL